jgi:hypothetical protein
VVRDGRLTSSTLEPNLTTHAAVARRWQSELLG